MNAYVSYSWTCCTKVICILVTQGLVSRGTISNTRFSGKKYIFFHPFLLGGYLGLLLFPFNLWNRLKPASVYYGQRFLKRIDISVQQFMYNWTPTICTFCPTHKKKLLTCSQTLFVFVTSANNDLNIFCFAQNVHNSFCDQSVLKQTKKIFFVI